MRLVFPTPVPPSRLTAIYSSLSVPTDNGVFLHPSGQTTILCNKQPKTESLKPGDTQLSCGQAVRTYSIQWGWGKRWRDDPSACSGSTRARSCSRGRCGRGCSQRLHTTSILAVAGNVAGLQAAEAQIARTNLLRACATMRSARRSYSGQSRAMWPGLWQLRQITSGFSAVGAAASAGAAAGSAACSLPMTDRADPHAAGCSAGCSGGAATSSVVRSALGGERGRTTSHSGNADNHASPPSGAAGFSGQSRAM